MCKVMFKSGPASFLRVDCPRLSLSVRCTASISDPYRQHSNNSKSLWKNERAYCPAHLLVLCKLLMLSSTGIGCAFLSMSTTLPRQISQPITKLFFCATEKQVNCTTFQLEVGGRGEPTTANRWNAISHTTRIRMKTHLAPETKLSKRYWVS